jgi:hypothetical protein
VCEKRPSEAYTTPLGIAIPRALLARSDEVIEEQEAWETAPVQSTQSSGKPR